MMSHDADDRISGFIRAHIRLNFERRSKTSVMQANKNRNNNNTSIFPPKFRDLRGPNNAIRADDWPFICRSTLVKPSWLRISARPCWQCSKNTDCSIRTRARTCNVRPRIGWTQVAGAFPTRSFRLHLFSPAGLLSLHHLCIRQPSPSPGPPICLILASSCFSGLPV